ncbi:hypothetical protein LCGC14_0440730 [marine sediment metagenome]|uniref:EF-hand domain-containing protein n=1 Tax=marine sediment metagenome TaxID=412755 RepID=A0A0F9V7E1_9ZZZZ|nr:hypothetical protein [Methylophaga sp.]
MLKQLIASSERNIIQFDPVVFWGGWTIIMILCVVAFYRMTRGLHQARLIENTPTAKIRSAVQGYVELNGQTRIMDGPVIVSPLSGKSCVWYRYKIEEKSECQQADGKSVSYWRVVKEETSGELFLLEDDTGRCIIDPDDADVIVSNKRTWHKNTSVAPRRYTEELITEHEPLYAIGLFKTIANIERQKLREQISQLLRHWKRDPNRLLDEFDLNRDGELSIEEWQRVQLAAEQHVKRQHGEQEKQEQLNVLKQSHHRDQVFILSTVSEEKLIKYYKWQTMQCLLGFFISGCLLVWAINIRLGL